jgi:hypothetical protein
VAAVGLHDQIKALSDSVGGFSHLLNDAISIYFLDATLASAFVARWCAGYKGRDGGGRFQGADR